MKHHLYTCRANFYINTQRVSTDWQYTAHVTTLIRKVICVTSLPMAGSPLRPLQGGSRRTTLLREPRKPVSWTRTEERQVEGSWSSREPRAERARREVVSAAAPPPHDGVTISGTSGGPRSSMPLPRQRSHRNPPCSDASECSHSSTARSKADAFSNSAIAVFCIEAQSIPFHTLHSSFLFISISYSLVSGRVSTTSSYAALLE